MRTLALTIAYDGTDWYGFQRQRSHPSIQESLEIALSKVFQYPVTILAGGRTDAGVHAIGQVVSFRTGNPIPLNRIGWVTNHFLPSSIRVRKVVERGPYFHARFSAGYRRYQYYVQTVRKPDPIGGRFCWQIDSPLNAAAMSEAVRAVQGIHDFAAYCHYRPVGTTERTVHQISVRKWRNGLIFDIQADAFLHQMVRLMVANVVLIGKGERPVSWLKELLESGERHLAGKAAPPCGLFLMRIGYPPSEHPKWGNILEKLNHEELFG